MIGVRVPAEAGNFSLHYRGPPSFLFNGYRGRGVKLTTDFHLVPRSKMRGVIPPFPH